MRKLSLHFWSRLGALLGLLALLGLFLQLFFGEFRLPLSLSASLILLIILSVIALSIYLWKAQPKTAQPRALRVTLFLLMINLPLAAFYLYFLHLQLNSVQLTLKNNTPEVITELQLISCAGNTLAIEDLEAGEGQSLWLPVSEACPLSLQFKHNSNIYIKTVHTNLNPALVGNKLIYYIEPNQWPLDKPRPERKKKPKRE